MSVPSYGALKTLLLMLQAAPSMGNVAIIYGEENVNAQDQPLPMAVIVPTTSQFKDPGYIKAVDPNINMIWGERQSIDIYLWGADEKQTPPYPQEIDHADATETLKAFVLQALQSQAPNGLYYFPVSGRWERMQNAAVRYGRAYVLTVMVDIGIPDRLYQNATITEITLTPSIEG